jgi:hypothetical protein
MIIDFRAPYKENDSWNSNQQGKERLSGELILVEDGCMIWLWNRFNFNTFLYIILILPE